MQHARNAAQRSYSPYSGFRVGAAIQLANGEIISGSNQENASFPVGTCAERAAIFYAHSLYPDVPIEAIAVTAESDKGVDSPVSPCGMCRQAIAEYENIQGSPIRILLAGQTGPQIILESVGLMLPLQFNQSNLNK